MTIQELHYGIDLYLQEVNANTFGDILPEEKDFFINRTIISFINTRMTDILKKERGVALQDSVKQYDDLRSLIETIDIPVFQYSKIQNSYFGYLPANYMYLLRDESYVSNVCKSIDKAEKKTSKLFYVKLPIDYISTLEDIKLTVNGEVIFNKNTYNGYTNPVGSEAEKFKVYNLMFDEVNKTSKYEMKWQSYDDIYQLNGFIFLSYIPLNTLEFKINGNLIDTEIKEVKLPSYSLKGEYNIYPNRLKKTEDISDALINPFDKPKFYSNLSELKKDRIIVYVPKKSFINRVRLTYIRRPLNVDVYLNRTIELAESTHDTILRLVGEHISGVSVGTNYQTLINENKFLE